MESNIAGVLTAAAGCAASAAITVSVAVAAPAETGDALITSLVIGVVGLVMGRRMARPEVRRGESSEPGEREATIYQDPTQRRIDEVLAMVKWRQVTPEQGQKLIDDLRTHPLERDAPVPPYGTPEGTL